MIKPVRHDLTCYRGQTFLQQIYYKRSDQPWPLTGLTAKVEIRPSENSTRITKQMDCTVYDDVGMIELSMNAAETAQLQPGFYVWDLKTTDESDNVIYWLKGQFIVTGRVTE